MPKIDVSDEGIDDIQPQTVYEAIFKFCLTLISGAVREFENRALAVKFS